MRFLHTADTHVGYSAYHALSKNGMNQRETDVLGSFEWTVEKALELKVDAVVHSGDLFDSVRPSNRCISFALEQVIRLQEEDVPFIVISGNHDTPRMRKTGSVLRIFDHLRGVHPIFGTRPGKVEVGDVLFQGMGYVPDRDTYLSGLRELRPAAGVFNVAILHAGVDGLSVFRTGEFNEVVISQGSIPSGFDHIALGHYHQQVKVDEGVWYAGSLERLSFSEADHKKGVLLVDTDPQKIERVPYRPRNMQVLKMDGAGLSSLEILQRVRDIGEVESGSIVALDIINLENDIRKNIDILAVRDHFADALHFKLSLHGSDSAGPGSLPTPMKGLDIEFGDFISQYGADEKTADLARKYLGGDM